ncbi:MAG: type II secretion system protein GspG [Verrucomicrobia bacterium]|nr:type II secretion system protein GspG [Verrucomicrobiota bacterium]
MADSEKNDPSRRGFTLVELMVVILLISILAGLMFSLSTGVFQKGERSTAESQLQAISVTLEAYRNRFGDYPDVVTPRQLFDALDGKLGPRGQLLTPPYPPFLEAGQFALGDEENPELLDPWGQPYVYIYQEPDAQTRLSGFDLFSRGPDGKASIDGDGAATLDDDNLRYDD